MNEVQVHLDREWNMKRKVLGISAGISFLLFLLLFAISNRMVNSLDTQTIVKRWSEDGGNAHVSCFFSVNSGVSQDRIEELEHSYDSLLADAGILLIPKSPAPDYGWMPTAQTERSRFPLIVPHFRWMPSESEAISSCFTR